MADQARPSQRSTANEGMLMLAIEGDKAEVDEAAKAARCLRRRQIGPKNGATRTNALYILSCRFY